MTQRQKPQVPCGLITKIGIQEKKKNGYLEVKGQIGQGKQ